MPGQHSQFGPSGAHRWLACTASVGVEAALPDESSPYAAEGTLAHALGEIALREGADAAAVKKQAVLEELEAAGLKKIPTDMPDYVQAYVDYCRALPGQHYVEVSVPIAGMSDERGTSDFCALAGDTIYVVDLKYGKGKRVYAKRNPQNRLYGFGAFQELAFFHDQEIRKVVYVIHQPRLDHVDEWSEPVGDLVDWVGGVVQPKVTQIKAGDTEYAPGDEACRFCKARAGCPARTRHNLETAMSLFQKVGDTQDISLLSPEEVAVLLPQLTDIGAWVSEVQGYASGLAKRGETVPGYKLVEGQSRRRWKSESEAIDYLRNTCKLRKCDVVVEKPIGIGAAEKLLGKKKPMLDDVIVRPNPSLSLVPEADPRKAVLVAKAEDVFSPVE